MRIRYLMVVLGAVVAFSSVAAVRPDSGITSGEDHSELYKVGNKGINTTAKCMRNTRHSGMHSKNCQPGYIHHSSRTESTEK